MSENAWFRQTGNWINSGVKCDDMDRAISPTEVNLINWLLDHALVDATAYRLHPIEELRVVEGCGCGCSSLYFKPHEQRGKLQILADELAVYPDGQQAGLILWGCEGEIAWLEVYDCQPESSHCVPETSNLCTWDELGRRDLDVANGRIKGKDPCTNHR